MSSTMSRPPILSSFTALEGGYTQAIAPGRQLVTLGSAGATWWENGVPVVVELPNIPVDGAQWSTDEKSLHVGLGRIDIASKTWFAEPSLAHWNAPGPHGEMPLKAAAWCEDGVHVALLLESRVDNKRSTEVVVVTVKDGQSRGRRMIEEASAIVCTGDRLMVAGYKVVVLDLDANVVSEPANMPPSVFRVREGAGTFAAVGVAGPVALVQPTDGALLATWDLRAMDAVPIPGGVVGVDSAGKVYVGCIEGKRVRTVAEADSGVGAPVIRVVGDQVVVAGSGLKPIRVATLGSACR